MKQLLRDVRKHISARFSVKEQLPRSARDYVFEDLSHLPRTTIPLQDEIHGTSEPAKFENFFARFLKLKNEGRNSELEDLWNEHKIMIDACRALESYLSTLSKMPEPMKGVLTRLCFRNFTFINNPGKSKVFRYRDFLPSVLVYAKNSCLTETFVIDALSGQVNFTLVDLSRANGDIKAVQPQDFAAVINADMSVELEGLLVDCEKRPFIAHFHKQALPTRSLLMLFKSGDRLVARNQGELEHFLALGFSRSQVLDLNASELLDDKEPSYLRAETLVLFAEAIIELIRTFSGADQSHA